MSEYAVFCVAHCILHQYANEYAVFCVAHCILHEYANEYAVFCVAHCILHEYANAARAESQNSADTSELLVEGFDRLSFKTWLCLGIGAILLRFVDHSRVGPELPKWKSIATEY